MQKDLRNHLSSGIGAQNVGVKKALGVWLTLLPMANQPHNIYGRTIGFSSCIHLLVYSRD